MPNNMHFLMKFITIIKVLIKKSYSLNISINLDFKWRIHSGLRQTYYKLGKIMQSKIKAQITKEV